VLVGAGLEMSALVSLRELLPKNAFGDALRWIALRLKIQTLLDDAEQSTGRISSLVEAVRSIARQERAEAADIDVHEQLRSALWVNLLDNAADAVNGGGEIAIQTQRDDNQTVVEIIDNGPGIPPENLSHIFEPFFTTKGVGSGKGLGLTISQGIAGDRHGGEIEVESKAGETRFIVRLPVRRIERNEAAEAIVASRAFMAELSERLEEMESRPPPQTPPFLKKGLRQFSTSRFSLSSTNLSASVFRQELRFTSRPGRRSFATAIRPTFSTSCWKAGCV
jgi:signal transduction histidine kinase